MLLSEKNMFVTGKKWSDYVTPSTVLIIYDSHSSDSNSVSHSDWHIDLVWFGYIKQEQMKLWKCLKSDACLRQRYYLSVIWDSDVHQS